MDTETANIWISFMFAKAMQWGVPLLILAVLASIAAWRHRMVGMWLLAVAAILTLAARLWLMLLIRQSGGSHEDLRIVSYSHYLELLISIGGWAVLAFERTGKTRTDNCDGSNDLEPAQ
jgi:hypothetical protein